MAIRTLAKKEMLLLLRDRLAAVLLLGMPLLFILILGLLLGESDQKLRITLVNLDTGTGLGGKESWAQIVERDLSETGGINIEVIDGEGPEAKLQNAENLIHFHKRAAIIVFQPTFMLGSTNALSSLKESIRSIAMAWTCARSTSSCCATACSRAPVR